MEKDADGDSEEIMNELTEWQEELDRLQKLRPVQLAHDIMKAKEIPTLEAEIKQQETSHPDISSEVEKVSPQLVLFLSALLTLPRQISEHLEELQRQVKDIISIKQQASNIGRLQKEIARATQDASQLENSLLATGSTKTADDVQSELSTITEQMYVYFPVVFSENFIPLSLVAKTRGRAGQ